MGCGTMASHPNCLSECDSIGGSCHCGPLAIKKRVFNECVGGAFTLKFNNWHKCSTRNSCARKCAMNYIQMHGAACVGKSDINQMTCEEQARVYKGGATGCNDAEARQFARTVNQCCGKTFIDIS